MYVLGLFFCEPAYEKVLESQTALCAFFQNEYADLLKRHNLSPEDPLFLHRCMTQVVLSLFLEDPSPAMQLAYFNYMANLDDKYMVPFPVYRQAVEFFLEDIHRIQIRDGALSLVSGTHSHEKQEVLLRLLKRYESQLKKEDFQLRRLAEKARESELVIVEIYLTGLQGDDKKQMEIMVAARERNV